MIWLEVDCNAGWGGGKNKMEPVHMRYGGVCVCVVVVVNYLTTPTRSRV